MADSNKDNGAALEWLKLKTDKGRKPDFQIKAEMEDVGNKFIRKFKENPLVPIGKLIFKINNRVEKNCSFLNYLLM